MKKLAKLFTWKTAKDQGLNYRTKGKVGFFKKIAIKILSLNQCDHTAKEKIR